MTNLFVCEFMGECVAGNELLRCFAGDAFLFIDSIIITIKEALRDGTLSKEYNVRSKCDVEGAG